MVDDSARPSAIRHLVRKAWSADEASAVPDSPLVRGFAEFGLPQNSSFIEDNQLSELELWDRDSEHESHVFKPQA